MKFSSFYSLIKSESEVVKKQINNTALEFDSSFFDNPVIVDLNEKTTFDQPEISDRSAIYIFRTKQEYNLTSITDFNDGIGLAQMRMSDGNKYKILAQEVFYIGECVILSSRMSAHLSLSPQKKGVNGLHLSNSNRMALRNISEIVIFPFKKNIFPSTIDSEQQVCRESIELELRALYLPCIGK